MLSLLNKYIEKKISKIIRTNEIEKVFLEIYEDCGTCENLFLIELELLYLKALQIKSIPVHLSLLKLAHNCSFKPSYLIMGKEKNTYEISEGLSLHEGTFFKVIRSLKLKKTMKAFIYSLMKENEEYQDKEFIKKCEEQGSTDLKGVFEKETKEIINKIIKI